MSNEIPPQGRRDFLKKGTLAAVAFSAGASVSQGQEPAPEATGPGVPKKPLPPTVEHKHSHVEAEYDGFSRYQPSRGHDPDSDYYLGKLVPGFRKPADGPAPITTPDLEKLPFKMVDGVKEFHVSAEEVSREFLPGYHMNVYGYNGSLPGPLIEINQGDRIRILVTNNLSEATNFHMHGFEMPVQYDGAAEMTQNPIKPGKTFKYEFDVHEEGTFFYHSHVAMQEAMGMVGPIVVHPAKPFDPPVDRDFMLVFQNFFILPNQTVSDSWSMDWNWHTINGRSGPYTTPCVVKHGERVRVRLIDFSPMQHHPIHMHGHTFWVTAHEGARAPKTAWIPRNTELVAVAQASEFEFIANNPGDWQFHCHMVHHMMNHMTRQNGPRIRQNVSVDHYMENLDVRPTVTVTKTGRGTAPPGYPQKMQGMEMSMEFMKKVWQPREMKGMREAAPMSMKGLMTSMRVLPDDLFHRVMETDEKIEKGSIFAEIVNRFGNPADYKKTPPGMMEKMMMHEGHS
ncbi:multicopper oxidase domain-containing protein [Thalassoglobus sp.]|uniref:multicopper oxidase domain-containing protein n=1 Tax=Thalassoglobus sp. TaxID=2795869 RepID=UPI003AA8C537